MSELTQPEALGRAPVRASGAFAIWWQAVTFHVRLLPGLLGILPVFFIPVVGDALQTVLVARQAANRRPDFRRAVGEAFRAFPVLALMKVEFELQALLWSFVPVYGAIKGMRERLHWAMASNVVILEGLGRREGCERCREIVDGGAARFMVRTLVIVPMLLVAGVLCLAVGVATFLERGGAATWGFVAAAVWIFGPGSGAVNTILYRSIIDTSGLETDEAVGT